MRDNVSLVPDCPGEGIKSPQLYQLSYGPVCSVITVSCSDFWSSSAWGHSSQSSLNGLPVELGQGRQSYHPSRGQVNLGAPRVLRPHLIGP